MITGPANIIRRARKLRNEMSLPEVLLWRELRKRPDGLKFRRQHPAGLYVIDFYCAVARICEVCGQRIARGQDHLPVPLHHPADGPPPRSGED